MNSTLDSLFGKFCPGSPEYSVSFMTNHPQHLPMGSQLSLLLPHLCVMLKQLVATIPPHTRNAPQYLHLQCGFSVLVWPKCAHCSLVHAQTIHSSVIQAQVYDWRNPVDTYSSDTCHHYLLSSCLLGEILSGLTNQAEEYVGNVEQGCHFLAPTCGRMPVEVFT